MKKHFAAILIIMMAMIASTSSIYAKESFRFKQSTYTLRDSGDIKAIEFVLPKKYSAEDIVIQSKNKKVVTIVKIGNVYYAEAKKPGTAKIQAKIRNSKYSAQCTVVVKKKIIFSSASTNNKIGKIVKIDSYSADLFSVNTKQAIEVSIVTSRQTGPWIRLAEGIFGDALRRKYNINVYENCTIRVRQLIWWKGSYYNGEKVLYQTSFKVVGINPIASIGQRIHIYSSNKNLTVGKTMQLKVQFIEMSKKSNVKWKSYQPSIVSVDSKGKVKGLKSGTSRIEARTKVKGKEYVDVYEVKVVKNNIMSIAKIE